MYSFGFIEWDFTELQRETELVQQNQTQWHAELDNFNTFNLLLLFFWIGYEKHLPMIWHSLSFIKHPDDWRKTCWRVRGESTCPIIGTKYWVIQHTRCCYCVPGSINVPSMKSVPVRRQQEDGSLLSLQYFELFFFYFLEAWHVLLREGEPITLFTRREEHENWKNKNMADTSVSPTADGYVYKDIQWACGKGALVRFLLLWSYRKM